MDGVGASARPGGLNIAAMLKLKASEKIPCQPPPNDKRVPASEDLGATPHLIEYFSLEYGLCCFRADVIKDF